MKTNNNNSITLEMNFDEYAVLVGYANSKEMAEHYECDIKQAVDYSLLWFGSIIKTGITK